jgi:hypothetical protein
MDAVYLFQSARASQWAVAGVIIDEACAANPIDMAPKLKPRGAATIEVLPKVVIPAFISTPSDQRCDQSRHNRT